VPPQRTLYLPSIKQYHVPAPCCRLYFECAGDRGSCVAQQGKVMLDLVCLQGTPPGDFAEHAMNVVMRSLAAQ
jgi:hypothetical protein